MTQALESTTVIRRVALAMAITCCVTCCAKGQDGGPEPARSPTLSQAETDDSEDDSQTESTQPTKVPAPASTTTNLQPDNEGRGIDVGAKSSSGGGSVDEGLEVGPAPSSEDGKRRLRINTDLDATAPGRALPDVYLLPDAEGRLQTVLGFSYEDFLEAWRQKQAIGEPVRSPRFTLSTLQIQGQVKQADRAELAIRVDAILQTDEQVEIPLGLGDAILLEAQFEGDRSTGFIHFDEANRRFCAWTKGQPGEHRTIQIKAIRRLENNGRSARLEIMLPKATVSSFELVVPTGAAEARANRGTVALTERSDGATAIDVQGPSADFSLAWSSQRTSSNPPPVLQATGAILTTIDGRGIVSDARLTMETLAGSLNRCRVQLPAGARLRSVSEGDFTWELLESEPTPKNQPKNSNPPVPIASSDAEERELIASDSPDSDQPLPGAVVEFQFATPQKDPVELRLITEQPLRGSDDGDFVEIGGFSVPGAVRQFGHVGLRVDRQWRLEWRMGDAVRQSANLPETLNRHLLAAGFEYSRRQWSLHVKVTPRPSQITVSTDQLLIVDRETLIWRGTLDYSCQGNSLFAIRLAMPDWDIVTEDIEPLSKVDAAGAIPTSDGVVTIPLREPVDGNLTVTITARRQQPSLPGDLDVRLPEIRQAALTSGRLTVVAPSYLALEPNDQACRGLERMPEPKDVALPVRVWGPRFLAYRTYLPTSRFAAAVTERSRSVRVETTNRMVLHADRAVVEQHFRWSIQNAPTERLEFDVPQNWLSAEGLGTVEATINEQTVFLEPVSGASDVDAAARPSRLEIRLPEPQLGRVDVKLRFQTPYTLTPDQPQQWVAFPFAFPVTAVESRSRTIVLPAPSSGITFAPTKDQPENANAWRSASRTSRGDQEGEQVFEATGTPDDLQLSVRLRPDVLRPNVTIHRAWFQTVSLGEVERTRYTCVLQTARPTIGIRFAEPSDVDIEEILLDGRIVRFAPGDDNFLHIPIGKEGREDVHRLELTVRRGAAQRLGKQLELPSIEFEGVTAFHRVYWQIVVPSHVHLLDVPKGWTSEFAWQFPRGYGERIPNLSEDDLAAWVGKSNEPSHAPATNTYLLGAFDLPSDLHVNVIRRSTLLFWASGGSLGIGLLLLYLPPLRRPSVLLASATLLSAVALGFPDAAILIVQAASLGLLLTALAVALRHHLEEWSQPAPSIPISESTVVRLGTLSNPLLKPTLTGGSSTRTTPAVPIQPHASDR